MRRDLPHGFQLRSRPLGSLAVLVAVLVGLAAPAGAQSGDPEADKRANQERQRQVDSQLDAASASEQQLTLELVRLDGEIAAGENRAKAARDRQAESERALAGLRDRVAAAEASVAEARKRAADQAVSAYMRPDRESATALLAARDPQELGKMKALVGEVAEHNQSVVQSRVAAEGDLRQKKTEAEHAEVLARAAADQADAELAAITRRRQEQAAVRDEIERRIEHLKSEQSALDAQESQLSSIIAERQRQVAARRNTGGSASSGGPVGRSAAPDGRVSGAGFIWPTKGTVSSGFGARWGTVHTGLDISAPTGTPIWAANAGEVFFAGPMGGYGNAVLVDHGSGMTTLYGHQSRIGSSVGQNVARGQVIGYVGSTGNSTGPHLHFEVRIGDKPRDPAPYLP